MSRADYGNRAGEPVRIGDLATYRTVGAGLVKVKVLDVGVTHEYPFHMREYVKVRVTSRGNPIYPQGWEMDVSSLWLSKR